MYYYLFMAFKIPTLSYDFNALEPYIEARTMELHYKKHHQGYVDKLNAATRGTEAENLPLEDLLAGISRYSKAVRDNAGGHYNHSLFWTSMAAPSARDTNALKGDLKTAIGRKFGSIGQLEEKFSQEAAACFGSGWAWLCLDSARELFVCSTPNQDNPLMDVLNTKDQGTPLLGLDVWEHAYYLQYQNRRPEYIKAFWDLINWSVVSERFTAATSQQAKGSHALCSTKE